MSYQELESVSASVRRDGVEFPITGVVHPDFEDVFEAFQRNFRDDIDVGSAVAVYRNGTLVADLYGGFKDAAMTRPWAEDTIVNVMSITKAVAALAVHMLIDRGKIDLDAPVARYWPEFGQAGKQDLLVRYILDHRAGLPIINPPVPSGSLFDWELMVNGLAATSPVWTPGTAAGYHIRTQGFLIGELVRRVSGKRIGRFIAEEIAQPLGLDFHVGMSPEDFSRCAEFQLASEGTILNRARQDPDTLLYRTGDPLPDVLDYNTPVWRISEIPSSNGHSDARSIARLYALLTNGGELDGVRLLSAEAIRTATAEQHNMRERVMERSYHQALGFIRNSPPIVPLGPNADAFGHHGVGGSLGMGDPQTGTGFGYVMNKMHPLLENGPRAGRLLRAVFGSSSPREENKTQ